MKNKSIGDDYKLKNPHVNLFYRAMRITTFLLFFCSFCALADNVNSQTAKVTIKRSNVTLLDVLNEIENQTNYLFIYSNDINVKRPVSINVNAKAVNSVLAKLFAGKDVAYQMEGTHIVLTKTEKSLNEVSVQQQSKRMENITGVVLDEAGEPIIGASVKVQNTTIGTITDLKESLNWSFRQNLSLKYRLSDIGRKRLLSVRRNILVSIWKKILRRWTK